MSFKIRTLDTLPTSQRGAKRRAFEAALEECVRAGGGWFQFSDIGIAKTSSVTLKEYKSKYPKFRIRTTSAGKPESGIVVEPK